MAAHNANDFRHHWYIYLHKQLIISYIRILFSSFNFPMPLVSIAYNIILPLEKVRTRNLLLWSLHSKITSVCWFDVVSVKFCECNTNNGKHCPTIWMTSVLPPKFIPTILEHTKYSTTSQLLINYIHSTFLNVTSNIQPTSQNSVFYCFRTDLCKWWHDFVSHKIHVY